MEAGVTLHMGDDLPSLAMCWGRALTMSRPPMVVLSYESSPLVYPSCVGRSRVDLVLGSSGELSVGSLSHAFSSHYVI